MHLNKIANIVACFRLPLDDVMFLLLVILRRIPTKETIEKCQINEEHRKLMLYEVIQF